MNTTVSIVRCSDYSKVKSAIKEALSLIGGLESIIAPGNRVLLKPNVLAIRPPEDAVTTHPAVVSAMCELIREVGGIPIIGDGSGGVVRPDVSTAEAFRASGIEAAASSCGGAELINFETSGGYTEVSVPAARQFPRLYIAKAVLEADVVISLPKLKTHELTLYTGGALKIFSGGLCRIRSESRHMLWKTVTVLERR